MPKWEFIVYPKEKNIDIHEELKRLIEKEAVEAVKVKKPPSEATYKVNIVFYQNPWRYEGKLQLPLKQSGDLDNILRFVFAGLGPIIGYHQDGSAKDELIVEVLAKKYKSNAEFITIEVETVEVFKS